MFQSVIIITTIISLIVSIIPQQVELGYHYLWVHPFIFLWVFSLILIPLIKIGQYRITVYSFIVIAWFRFTLIPLGSALTGIYNGVPYIYVGSDSIFNAILLVVYELLVTSSFLFILVIINKRKGQMTKGKYKNVNLILTGNKNIYALFILLAIVLYVAIGRNMNLIQLFIISAESKQRIGDLESTGLILIRQIIITSLIFVFVWIVSYCKKMYDVTGKKRYVYYAIIIAIFNIGVIVGERRTSQLYTALIVMFILVHVFENYRKRIISIVSLAAMLVLLFMSVYKHYSAFAYGSYYSALDSSSFDLEFITTNLQSYFFGTQNVATVFELSKHKDISIINMIYDFGRSVFGLNFFLKDKMEMTPEIFNTFIYGYKVSTGHIMSGIGYGYLYLGTILSPLFVCLNIFISTKLEWWFNKANSIEIKYIVGYILIRFSTNIFATTPPLISFATIFLFTAGLLYFLALIFKKSKKSNIISNN
ncbi:hypothetical protein V7654_18755 [Bacillus sp. JJ1609]|uniref:hypothetical protein n=1 Tax=Bacillus sp. JJ1609 TaxID=3122977 RepID=UPI002FFD9E93